MPPTSATSSGPDAPRRRARALTAWLSAADLRRIGAPTDPARARAARELVAARPEDVDQSGVIGEWPGVLAPHGDALRAAAGARRMFDEGWELALVTDLRRIVAAQPTVLADPAAKGPDPASLDLEALARLALPLHDPAPEIRPGFDEAQQRWILTSPNPNLRVTGRFGGEVQPGVLGFGFFFQVLGSFVSVAEFRGRLVLRDGYHRAHRLLASGVTAVPAFVRRFPEDEPPLRTGMLGPEVYAGPRPPTLADYLDDRLAADVWLAGEDTTAIVSLTPARLAVGRPAPPES